MIKINFFFCIFFHYIYSLNKWWSSSSYSENFWTWIKGFFWNHRGSGMNLRFLNWFYRVLTRKFLSIIIKNNSKIVLNTDKKNEVNNRIFKRPVTIKRKDEWADLKFWHYKHKEYLLDFHFFFIFKKDWNHRIKLRSLKLSIPHIRFPNN